LRLCGFAALREQAFLSVRFLEQERAEELHFF